MCCLSENFLTGNTKVCQGNPLRSRLPRTWWQMNIAELLPSEDKKYCLLMVCMVSAQPEVFPLAKADAQTVIKASLNYIIPIFLWFSSQLSLISRSLSSEQLCISETVNRSPWVEVMGLQFLQSKSELTFLCKFISFRYVLLLSSMSYTMNYINLFGKLK